MPRPGSGPKSLLRYTTTSSVGLVFICFVASLIALFSPTPHELLLLALADGATAIISWFLTDRIFLALHPEAAIFSRGLDEARFAELSKSEKARTIETFSRFPSQLARYLTGLTAVRSIPGVCIVVFIWHDEAPRSMQILGFVTLLFASLIYVFGTTVLDGHVKMSRLLAYLHSRHSLQDVYLQVRIPKSRMVQLTEGVVLAGIVIFTLALQGILLLIVPDASRVELGIRGAVIGFTGLSMFLRVWYLGRTFFIEGLEQIFDRVETLDPRKAEQTLPLHSSPLLATFDQSFNLLTERLRASQQEISFLMRREAERSRLEALGEISGLIAHDLSGPLHVAQYCATELLENPENPRRLRQIEYLAANVGRAVELVNTLRQKLRSPDASLLRTPLLEAHQQVLHNLSQQFPATQFHRVRIELDSKLRPLELRVPRVDLVHILDNLYRNSIQNMLENRITSPELRIKLEALSDDSATLILSDNGTGLTPEAFAQLSDTLRPGESSVASSPSIALGLRLTLRLIELNRGSLKLEPSAASAGTHYSLTLPRSSSDQETVGSEDLKKERGIIL